MLVEAAFYQYLTANAGVSALVSTRGYPLVIPQDAPLPAWSYQVVSTPMRPLAHDNSQQSATKRVQVTVQALTYEQAKTVAAAMRVALSGFRGWWPAEAAPDKVEIWRVAVGQDYDGHEMTDRKTVRFDVSVFHSEAVAP